MHLRQSIYERKYPKTTNENSAKEFVSKLETIKKLWRDQNPHLAVGHRGRVGGVYGFAGGL
jgi:hypothetical protein